MKKSIILCALVLALAAPAFARDAWQEGRLSLSASALADGYQSYKIALYMDNEQGAVLFNDTGKFGPQDTDPGAGEHPNVVIAQRLINAMLGDCRRTAADFCSHQIPIHYRRQMCTPAQNVPCLAIDFPINPERLDGKRKTVYIVAPIRPAADVAADMKRTCLESNKYACQ